MIFSTLTPEKKKKLNRGILIFGAAVLLIGLIPGWLAYQWGIVIFVFCLVATGIVNVIIPEPEPQEYLPTGDSHMDKILKKTEEEEPKQKTEDPV